MQGRTQQDPLLPGAASVLVAASMVLFCSAAFATDSVPAIDSADPGAGDVLQGSALALDVDPLALTPEMKRFADERIAPRQSRQARLLRLQEAIFDTQDGLGVTYGSAETRTAAGTFEHRSGNCLSFTLLFVALARHIGLETYFVEVDEVTGWSQRGDVGFNHWHMYAEVEIESAKVPVDFLPWTERRYRSSRRIPEPRVLAHFHNNLGADLVSLERYDEALLHLGRALELDGEFHPARINLAVAYRRIGRSAEAERLLLRVLDAQTANSVAAANLATLYLEQGRRGEAAKWMAKRAAFLNRNPFHHFRQGLSALDAGEYTAARDHFKRAISRQRDEALFYESLAAAHMALGQERKARSSLRRALHYTENKERRRFLEESLRQVGASGRKGT